MHIETRISKLLHFFSPKGWLAVVFVSMALAGGAAMLLLSPVDGAERRFIHRCYDLVERFFRDTIRLTFKDRAIGDSSDSVFVAPKGILQKDADFALIENPQDIESQHEDPAPVSLAPARLLDSEWIPVFSGLPIDHKNP